MRNRSIAIVRLRPLWFPLSALCLAVSVSVLVIGLSGEAGLGRNALAILFGSSGALLFGFLLVMVVLRRGALIRGFADEVRVYNLFPSRSRAMVQRVAGRPSEIEISILPELPSARPSMPKTRWDGNLIPEPPKYEPSVFRIRGPDGEVSAKIVLQGIRWDFEERLDRWRSDFDVNTWE